MKKKLLAVVALLLVAVLLLSGCSSHGKTMIKAGNEKISVNLFQLYLSRMKGELASAGYSVNSADFWNKVIDTDGTTQNEYFTNRVFEGLKQIAAALMLYEAEGLSLDQSVEDDIDAWIEELIDSVGNGSKKEFNSILSAYGANVTVLRDSAIIDAKIAQLKTHLYGEGGRLIGDTAMEQFYKDTYYRGKQMLLANYYYDHDKDADGRTVYYKADGDGNLVKDPQGRLQVAYDTAAPDAVQEGDVWRTYGIIAYDKENGKPSKDYARDEDGYLIYYQVDAQGNYLKDGDKLLVAYDTENGKQKPGETDDCGNPVYRKWVISYDSENGEPKYKLDSNGDRVMADYSDEEMDRRLWMALEIKAACKDNEELFEENMRLWSDNASFNETYAPNGMYFSAGTYTTDTIFYTFSTELAKLEEGELEILDSDSGYYIIMRCELDDGAWGEEENSRWFGTMRGLLMEYLLQQASAEYLDDLKINEELRESVDITMVAANNYY